MVYVKIILNAQVLFDTLNNVNKDTGHYEHTAAVFGSGMKSKCDTCKSAILCAQIKIHSSHKAVETVKGPHAFLL